MKYITSILLLFIILSGCEDTQVGSNKSTVKKEVTYIEINDISSVSVREFEYKGHTYIYSTVRDGIAMSHAGHCVKCYKK